MEILCLQDGPSYVRVFLNILRNITKEETVEYVLALIDEMLAGGQLLIHFVDLFVSVIYVDNCLCFQQILNEQHCSMTNLFLVKMFTSLS